LKLLAKNPEERYQSAEGLKHDLEKLHERRFEDFQLGERDFSGKLQIPEKLYGRELEIEQLLSAYRAVGKGQREMILVAGYSGTGKTALVNEIHKPITKDRGYFISGKFDQLQRAIPYFAFIQALNQFCQLILTEKQEILAQWKERILNSVGDLGKVLNDIVPQLEAVIGEQPDVPEVGGDDAKKRFNYVFQRFLQAASSEEHPLVMFIDDLQWTDLASLSLLRLLMEDPKNRYLLFIGAYRDNEVSPNHPLMTTLEEIRKQDIVVHSIPVKNLLKQHVREWLRDTLKLDGDRGQETIQPLSNLIYEKTQGNAFFTIQFLENLYKENLLRFDFKRAGWTWDITKIEKQKITDNVVDLLTGKIRALPGKVQEVLKLASCIGNVFDLHTLSVISEKDIEDHGRALEIALTEHLVYPLDDGSYQFVHDRIHHAAYSLISENLKKPLHLKIGRLLFKDFEISKASKEEEQQIFKIVNHLNTGIDLIENEKEKIELAQLNLKAGQNAKISAAYKLGADYVQTAIRLLPEDCLQRYYDFSLTIYNEALQTSYLLGNFEEMENFVEKVLGFAHDISHKSTAYEYRLLSLMAQNLPHKAIDMLIEIFGTLGVDIPRKPGQSQNFEILQKTHAMLMRKGIASLKGLPLMDDHRNQLIMRLFYMGATAFVFAGQDVLPYVVSKITAVILKYGLAPETPYTLTLYGLIRLLLGDISGAYQLGEISMELLDGGLGNEAVRGRSVAVICIYMLGQKKNFKEVCRQMVNHYPYSLNAGDFEYAAYLLTNYIMCLSRTDTELTVVSEKARLNKESVIQLKQAILMPPLTIEIAYNDTLLGKTSNPAALDIDTDNLFKDMQTGTIQLFTWQINIKNVILAYLFEDDANLPYHLENGEKNGKNLNVPMTYTISDTLFYFPLAYLRLYERADAQTDKENYLGKAKQTITIMRKWAKFGAANFLHKYYLLSAEFHRVTGKHKRAAEFYDRAIETAYENEFVNEAALANEQAAKFYLQKKQGKLAAIYFMEARDCYRKWGAVAKVKHLEEKYPKYLSLGFLGPMTKSMGTDSASSTDSIGDLLDVKSIVKATHTLSGEVQLKGLMEKMIQILIENAGAKKCVLIENTGESLLIQAEGSTYGVSGVLQELPMEESDNVPLSVVNYVARSKERLVFDNISKDPNYSTDSYIQKNQTKSVVCFPILSKGNLSAVIYLENSLVEGAFTPERLEILNMLSTQIAISVENTHLYEQLEEKVRQRTIALQKANEELENKHRELEESHRKINDSVNYASKIQHAVLPARETFEKLLPRHFILYRPCSVVSGDFYWIKETGNKIVVVAADCTGHGVPGALVSMLGMAFLNEIVPHLAAQSRLTAANILDALRHQVKIALQQKGKLSEQKDGMDIALCIIDPVEKQLQYAGAYNPLYLIRGNKLTEVNGDRMPVGIYRKERPFTLHEMPFQGGEMIYLFTDGFIHQNSVGSETFTRKRFKEVLLDIYREPVSKQEDALVKRFDEWKGDLPQRDDILILGIRLPGD